MRGSSATLVFLCALLAGSPAAPGPRPDAPALVSLEAFLFSARSGRLEKENVAIAATDRHIPPSLITGPGQPKAEGPASGVVVVVAVSGAATDGMRVSLEARVGSKTILREVVRARDLAGAADGPRHLPFLLRRTSGCATVTLIAELHGGGVNSERLERLLPFRCLP
jgi:hypothetical protein